MFLKTRDYTVWAKDTGSVQRYFIKYHGQKTSPTCEITFEVFTLYIEEFYRPLEKQRNERRRHLAGGEIERLMEAGLMRGSSYEHEDSLAIKYTIEAVLQKCTTIQRRRFNLHHVEGYTFMEIGRIEGCDYSSVKESVNTVKKKIKIIFSDAP